MTETDGIRVYVTNVQVDLSPYEQVIHVRFDAVCDPTDAEVCRRLMFGGPVLWLTHVPPSAPPAPPVPREIEPRLLRRIILEE